MALGSVSIVPFTTAELTENFGTVSIIPCTRAEIVKMFKEKMNPYGKVVWSGTATVSSGSGDTLTVANSVDYVSIDDTIVSRGYSAQKTVFVSYAGYTANMTFSISFTNGKLRFSSGSVSGSSAGTGFYVPYSAIINCIGYHYY